MYATIIRGYVTSNSLVMFEEVGLCRILTDPTLLPRVQGSLTLEEILFCTFAKTVIVQILAYESFLPFLILNMRAFSAPTDIASVVLDGCLLMEHVDLLTLLIVGVVDIASVHGLLRPLDVLLWCRKALPLPILSITLHRLLWVEEVLSSSIAFHFSFLEHLAERGRLVLEEFQWLTVSLICLVGFTSSGRDVFEVFDLDSVLRVWSL